MKNESAAQGPLWPWVLLASLPLIGWWTYGLFDLDEGFYAAVVSEMNRRGEWLTPYYNGEPWFEKPILLYWIGKPALAIFGEWVGPRLPSILSAVATYALIAWFARRRLSAGSGKLAPLVLGSSILFVAVARMMMTDPLMVLCLTAALLTFWESLVDAAKWRLWTAALLGLAVLAKGPVALIFFGLIAGFTYWRERDLRSGFRGYWIAGTGLMLLVIATWYLPAYLVNGDAFVEEFLIRQNVQRFLGGDAAHTLESPWALLLYVPILLLGMAPWTFTFLGGFFRKKTPTTALQRYLLAWATIIFVFFSLSGAKLPHYILPVLPPLALLAADFLSSRWQADLSWRRLTLIGAWLAFVWTFVQFGFTAYYRGLTVSGLSVPGSHAEVHRLALFVRQRALPGDTVAVYRMLKREDAKSSGRLKINETTHPSLLLYLDRTVLDTDDWDALLSAPKPAWIITRWNRLTPKQEQQLQQVRTPWEQDLYRLYKLEGAVREAEGMAPN